MIKTINIKNDIATWETDNIHQMADNEPLIVCVKPKLVGFDCRIYVTNGAKSKTLNVTKETVEIPKELVTQGKLNIVVDFLKNAAVYKKINVEPLLINNFQEKYETIPQIADMEKRVTAIEESVEKLETAIKILGGVL